MHLDQKLQPLFILLIAAVISFIFLLWPKGVASRADELHSFATCLKQKNVVMYGNDRCEKCEAQKKMFGPEFSNINYVNCDFQDADCKKQQIQYTPTWVFQEKTLVGLQSFAELAALSSCNAPKI